MLMKTSIFHRDISSFTLHIMAMAFMLCDHLWATLLSLDFLSNIGRLAFPIFAFLCAEGFRRTGARKRYMLRMLIFALISEIPFNFFYGGAAIYPFHQNVLFTFLLALCLMAGVDKVRRRGSRVYTALALAGAAVLGMALSTLCMVDYYGAGVLSVLVFYVFSRRRWLDRIAQLLCLYYLNVVLLRGFQIPVTLGGLSFEIPRQGLALISLLFIWLYQGRQGPHPKWFRWFCYAFYPAHLAVLTLVLHMLIR